MKKITNQATIRNLKPQMIVAWDILDDILSNYGGDAIVTTGDNGKHSSGSLHYVGFALDFRSHNLKESSKREIKKEFDAAVGAKEGVRSEYDFVIESTHFHIEYQPK